MFKDADDIVFESLPFDHPLYIMYSSGTTGKPKSIVHSSGGTLLQHLKMTNCNKSVWGAGGLRSPDPPPDPGIFDENS